mgnify:CR=1 FL=1
MTRALVLGGGGVVGIAWETGVLKGLRDGGVDPATADLVSGFFEDQGFAIDRKATFDLDGELSEEDRASLIRLTERYCVVYQTLRQPPPIAVTAGGRP